MLSPRPAELAHRVGGSFCVLQQCSPNFCLDSVKQIWSMPQKPGTLFIGRGGTREVSPMRLSTAMPIETRPRYFTPCAQCGDALLAPEWSEHVNERCVRHLWTCETCGYQFETTVYLGSK